MTLGLVPLRPCSLALDFHAVGDLLDLAVVEQLAATRRASWQQLGLDVEFKAWPLGEKPAASLTLTGPDRAGDLTLWVSGEAEFAYGSTPGDVVQRHEDGVTVETVGGLMDELALRVADSS